MRKGSLLMPSIVTIVLSAIGTQATPLQDPPRIATHDNDKPAGRLENGEVVLSLWAGEGTWYPEGERGAARRIRALGEQGGALSIPSPLLRVRAGARVRTRIRNTLSQPLVVRGLCDRPGSCDAVTIPPAATSEWRFTLNLPGTFHYWGTTTGARVDTRREEDSQLGGAIVVDPLGADASDRVFVMGLTAERSAAASADLTVINGRTWPLTERLHYTTGDTVRWRVINLTASAHAMHLHGFYFHVNSTGDGVRETRYADADGQLGVTHQMPPGGTMAMTWVPERAGNWLFHCHMLVHMMSPDQQQGGGTHAHGDDGTAGMGGLVLGIHVAKAETALQPGVGRDGAPGLQTRGTTPLRLQLIVQPDTRHGTTPSYKLDLVTGAQPPPRVSDRPVPGPVMVLTRGEPVAVEVINKLAEPTSIHWHGIELESYDDGVAGFGGTAGSVTPPVAPGGTFTARFTPSRAGTFIYHTHWHNAAQLAGGIYGPLVVLEPGQTYDPSTDHIVVLGVDGRYRPLPDESFVVNGESPPRALELKSGVPHRLRFINITPDNVALTVQLVAGFDPIQWTLIGKDGSDTPRSQRTARPARQLVTVGETYDFELAPMPPTPLGLWMELRRGNGELIFQWPVRAR